MSKADPKDEYIDVSDNMRHFGNIKFAQLTLFVASTAGLLTTVFQSNSVLSDSAQIVLKIAGFVTVVVFWMMDQRSLQYWLHYKRRAVELEKEIGYQQYTNAPARGIFTSTNALRLLFFCLSVFWIVTLIWHSQF